MMLVINFEVYSYGAPSGDVKMENLSIFEPVGGNEVRFRELVDLWWEQLK